MTTETPETPDTPNPAELSEQEGLNSAPEAQEEAPALFTSGEELQEAINASNSGQQLDLETQQKLVNQFLATAQAYQRARAKLHEYLDKDLAGQEFLTASLSLLAVTWKQFILLPFLFPLTASIVMLNRYLRKQLKEVYFYSEAEIENISSVIELIGPVQTFMDAVRDTFDQKILNLVSVELSPYFGAYRKAVCAASANAVRVELTGIKSKNHSEIHIIAKRDSVEIYGIKESSLFGYTRQLISHKKVTR